VRLHEIEAGRPVEIVGETFVPVKVPHGDVAVYGFRVGDLGYVTDAKLLPDEAMATLRGVKVLVLNALWFGKPHASHFNVEEAIEASRVVGAGRTYLTHLTHRVTQAELDERLPEGVYAAFDGLTVEID
jgi:phosphoribosyl 1,2-cyclic phosphate phosphodiesterase